MESKHDLFVQQNILPILEKNKISLMYHNNVSGTPMHGHTFLEISYITKGKVLHIRDGQSTVLEAGDFLIVDYGSMHSYSTRDNKKYSNLNIVVRKFSIDKYLLLNEKYDCAIYSRMMNYTDLKECQNIFSNVNEVNKLANLVNKIKQRQDNKIFFIQVISASNNNKILKEITNPINEDYLQCTHFHHYLWEVK